MDSTMTDSSGKKRPRNKTPADIAAEKKVKTTATGEAKTTAAPKSSGWAFGLMTSANGTAAPAAATNGTFSTPADKQKKKEEETPYMSAKSSPPAKAASKSKTTTKSSPAKSTAKSTKLDAVKENGASEDEVKVVYKTGSYFYTVLIVFLWITSCATLGALLVHDRVEHDLELFALRQQLLNVVPQQDNNKAAGDTQLEQQVQRYQQEAAEAKAKLAGYEKEFQETLGQLKLS